MHGIIDATLPLACMILDLVGLVCRCGTLYFAYSNAWSTSVREATFGETMVMSLACTFFLRSLATFAELSLRSPG